MTYCLGIVTKYGLVMASDSRTNAGYDQVNVCRKMYTFAHPGERGTDDHLAALGQPLGRVGAHARLDSLAIARQLTNCR